ncbi:hypothetical protein [Metapseudomonas resinovorans]|uniref:hypothetical protein n=1 Tax=Metapseudomonas resinovorans TaxID=53412 RepID=UPI0008709E88|nr:hypothetical protein [Pseudomonas resinovorans]
MTTTPTGNSSAVLRRSNLWFIFSALLVATGCAQNPDIRSSRDGTSGVTASDNPQYMNCVKDRQNAQGFTQEENGKTLLYIGSTDPTKASGLVELTSANGQNQFAVYQRAAWQDRGRLINAALACART